MKCRDESDEGNFLLCPMLEMQVSLSEDVVK